MRAVVQTEDGVVRVDLEQEEIVDFESGERLAAPEPLSLPLPRLVAAGRSGSTVVAVVDRRPPLVVSYDAGRTWSETGGGLPAGRAVAIDEDDPDLVLFAARNRLYVSRDGGRFWRVLPIELPEIQAIALTEA